MFPIVVKEGRRRRYIGFTINYSDEGVVFDKRDMIDAVRNQSVLFLLKDFREMGLFIIRFDGKQGIIRCRHTDKDDTIKLLKSINEINNHKVEIETVGTSGTIKSLVKKHMSN